MISGNFKLSGIDDVIEPWDIAIYRALAGGVTTVNILHGSANPIGGGNAVVRSTGCETNRSRNLCMGG